MCLGRLDQEKRIDAKNNTYKAVIIMEQLKGGSLSDYLLKPVKRNEEEEKIQNIQTFGKQIISALKQMED
jgi:hypothetical protein